MTKKHEKELSLTQLATLPDEQINYDDIPELDETFWQNSTYIEPQPNKPITRRKLSPET